MGLMKKYFNNTRKPDGFAGKLMILGMNKGHTAVSLWGLGCMPNIQPESILELGCGGGKNVRRLLERFPDTVVTGLDYSDVSVEETRKANRKAIDAGRCQVIQGDVSDLPFPDESFDFATAFETIYFWPGPVDSFRQVQRVLKPGGRFMIVNESDGQNPQDEKWVSMIDGMRVYTKDDLRTALMEAGFTSIVTHHDPKKHRLCLVATK